MSPQEENIEIEEMFKAKLVGSTDPDQKHIIEQFWYLIGDEEFDAAGIVFNHYWEEIRDKCLKEKIVLRRDDIIQICRRIIGDQANAVFMDTIMNDPNFVTFYRIETDSQREQSFMQIVNTDERDQFERETEIIGIVRRSFLKTLDQNLRQYDRFQYTFIEEVNKLLNELERKGLPISASELKKIIKNEVPILRSMEQELSIIDKYETRLKAIREKPKEKVIDEEYEKRKEQLQKDMEEEWTEIEAEEKKEAVQKRLTDSQFMPLILKEFNYQSTLPEPEMSDIVLILSLKGIKAYFENTFFNVPEDAYRQKIADAIRKAIIHSRDQKGIEGLKITNYILTRLKDYYANNRSKKETDLWQIATKEKHNESAASIKTKIGHIISTLQTNCSSLEEIILKG